MKTDFENSNEMQSEKNTSESGTSVRVQNISKGFKISFLIAFSILGFFFILIATSKHGIGLTPDSSAYISAARNLIHQNQLIRYDGSQFLHWPPFYPLILAIFELIGIHAFIAARYLNAFLFAGIIYLFGILILRDSKTTKKEVLLFSLSSVVLSVVLIQVAINAWSEPLFIFLVTGFFILFGRFLDSNKMLYFYYSLALAALIPLTRYVGVVIPIVGSIILLFKPINLLLSKRIRNSFVFGAISSFPILFWLLRNRIISNTFTGERFSTDISLHQNLFDVITRIGHWFVPIEMSQILIVLIFSSAFIFWFLNRRSLRTPYLQTSFLFSVAYILIVVILNTITLNDRISLNDRLVSPLYIPIMLFLFASFNLVINKNNEGSENESSFFKKFSYVLIFLWLIILFSNTGLFIEKCFQEGASAPNTNSYAKVLFQEDPLIKWLHSHDFEGLYFSNIPYLAYAFTWNNTYPLPENDLEVDSCLSQIKENEASYFIIFPFVSSQEDRNKLNFIDGFINKNFIYKEKCHSNMGIVLECKLKASEISYNN